MVFLYEFFILTVLQKSKIVTLFFFYSLFHINKSLDSIFQVRIKEEILLKWKVEIFYPRNLLILRKPTGF